MSAALVRQALEFVDQEGRYIHNLSQHCMSCVQLIYCKILLLFSESVGKRQNRRAKRPGSAGQGIPQLHHYYEIFCHFYILVKLFGTLHECMMAFK